MHLGFPKSASSTLQFGLWQPLEKSGELNLMTWRKTNPHEPLENRPSSKLFTQKEIGSEYLNFSREVPNILSDESFTAPKRLREYNFGKNIRSPSEFPLIIQQQIFDLFGEDAKIFPLVVLRNHSDLIFSQYVEEYNLKKYKGVDLIFKKNTTKIDLQGFEIYKFQSYILLLEEIFGAENITILFFEQITYAFERFCSVIANLTETSSEKVAKCFKTTFVNEKLKAKSGYWTKDGSHLIPYLNDKQKRDIVDYFSEDTQLLCKRFQNSVDLTKYGYLY